MFDKRKFKAAVLMAGKSYQDVADFLHIHINTLYVRIRCGEFSRAEINDLMQFLNLESPDEIFFAKEIT